MKQRCEAEVCEGQRTSLSSAFDSDLEVGFHLHAWARSIATAAQSDVEQWVRSFQLKKRTIHESPYGSVWLDDKRWMDTLIELAAAEM